MQDVTKLLQSAGLAIKALTDQSADIADGSTDIEVSMDSQREAFTAATSQYFSLLSSIDVRLRRQIYALDEANVLAPEAAPIEIVDTSAAALPTFDPQSGAQQEVRNKLVNMGGGLGNLDVGWLNSRNDKVGKEMEAELWAKAEELVKERLAESQVGEGKDEDGDAKMGNQWGFCALSRPPL